MIPAQCPARGCPGSGADPDRAPAQTGAGGNPKQRDPGRSGSRVSPIVKAPSSCPALATQLRTPWNGGLLPPGRGKRRDPRPATNAPRGGGGDADTRASGPRAKRGAALPAGLGPGHVRDPPQERVGADWFTWDWGVPSGVVREQPYPSPGGGPFPLCSAACLSPPRPPPPPS